MLFTSFALKKLPLFCRISIDSLCSRLKSKCNGAHLLYIIIVKRNNTEQSNEDVRLPNKVSNQMFL